MFYEPIADAVSSIKHGKDEFAHIWYLWSILQDIAGSIDIRIAKCYSVW